MKDALMACRIALLNAARDDDTEVLQLMLRHTGEMEDVLETRMARSFFRYPFTNNALAVKSEALWLAAGRRRQLAYCWMRARR